MAKTLPLEQRDPAGGPFLQLSGYVNDYGVRFLKHVGFKRKDAAWECLCPLCSKKFVCRGSRRKIIQSCGCVRDKSPDADRRNWLKKVWQNVISRDCSTSWEDFETFYSDVPQDFSQGSMILKRTVSLPYSKVNFRIYTPSIRSTHNCRTFIVNGEPITSVEIADLLKVSRQRVHQLMKYPERLRERIMQSRRYP